MPNKTKQHPFLEAMDKYTLTRADFEDNFKRILDFLNKLKSKNKEAISEARESLHKLSNELNNKLSGDNSQSITTLKEEFTKIANKALKEQEDGLNFLRDKVRGLTNGIDGKNADEVKIIKSVLDKIKLPEYKETVLDTPVQVAEKLELLKGDNRLKVEAINGLEEELEKLKSRPTGGGSRKVVYTKRINLSSQVNGTLKEFLLPKDTINVLGVWGTQFPVTFDEADFTFEGTTLTLTSEVGAPATGQTLFALIQTLFYGKI